MSSLRLELLALSLFVSGGPLGCAEDVSDRREETSSELRGVPRDFAGELDAIRREYGVPGLAAAIFDEDGPLAIAASGERRLGSGVSLGTRDRFHLGSETKAMTSTMIARRVTRGEARWDLTVGEAFPSSRVDPSFSQVTIRALLEHRGGAPEVAPGFIWAKMWEAPFDSRATRREAVLDLLSEPPKVEPGTFEYSNLDYMTAAAALERESSWEEQLTRDVFDPLGMTSCGFGFVATSSKVLDEPLGHLPADDGYLPVEPSAQADNPRSFGPAGTVHCSIEDYGKFLRAHLRAANGDTSYLSAEARSAIHTPARRAVPDEPDYGLGFYVVERSWTHGRALTHDGTNTMNYATAWIVPGIHRVFVAVSNAGGDEARKATDAVIVKLAGALQR